MCCVINSALFSDAQSCRNTGSVEVGSSILPGSTKHKPPDRVVFCLRCASRMLACRVEPQGQEELGRFAVALSVTLACFQRLLNIRENIVDMLNTYGQSN